MEQEKIRDRENLDFYLGETQRGLEAEHFIKLVQYYRTKYPRDSFADEISFKYATWLGETEIKKNRI